MILRLIAFKNKYIRKVGFYFALITMAAFASCSTIRSIPVEIAFYPESPVPDKIQSVTLLNRAVNSRFQDHRHDSLQQAFYNKQFNHDTLLLDTRAADTLVIALGNILFESGRYDVVIPENRFLNKEMDSFLPTLLSWDAAETLAEVYETDAVLSLDYFSTSVVTSYERETMYDQNSNQFYNVYIAGMKIAYETLFRLYYPAEKEIIKNIVISDTLYWDDAYYEIRPLFNRFTTVKDGMIETGIHAALRLSGKIAPIWRRTSRSYFAKGHTNLLLAEGFIKNGDWVTAYELWEDLAMTASTKSLRSKAEFNMALAYEMFGDIDEAIAWGLKSYQTMFRPVTYNYLEILNQRKQQIGD